MLTGRTLFDAAGNFVDLIRQIKETPPEPPRRLNPLVDVRLESICLKCLRKDPRERYGSAEALAEDLEALAQGGAAAGLAHAVAAASVAGQSALRRRRPAGNFGRLRDISSFLCILLLRPRTDSQNARRGSPLAARRLDRRHRSAAMVALEHRRRNGHGVAGERSAVLLHDAGKPRLELLRAAPGPRYRISAEIRHDRVLGNIGWVGLYFGHSQESTEEGPIHHWWDLTFADFGDQARPRKNKKAGAVHGQLAVARRRHGRPDELNIRLTDVRKTFATAEETGSSPIWRRLAVQVTPEKIQFSWDQQIFREITPAALGKFGEAWEAGDQPEIKFDPHGPFGLVVYKGKASFRNIIVEPVD